VEVSFESSLSDSLAAPISLFPRTLPLIELVALWDTPDTGVCGGVVNGNPEGWLEFVAATSGTEPSVGVGLFIGAGAGVWIDEMVLTEEIEADRRGLAAW
jgi:hypothetical protein